MRSSYRRIGSYVQQTNMRNGGLSVTTLQGVSINKHFMSSVANINGTDLSNYKVVTKEQFAFNPMHVGRDEVLPIAMLETDNPVIVSPAYVVFQIIDKQALLPEYLMMWCRRPEFDRNAWFTTDSSIRGGFNWDDFCEMKLPVPSIEKQREIVKEYHAIANRIKLNELLDQKLEETAQAIYKQWFIDFEFPISAEYAATIGKPDLEGQPYNSSGGEMVYNDVLKQEIPKGWENSKYSLVMDFKTGKLNSNAAIEDGIYPFFTCSSETYKTNTYSFDTEAILLAGNNASAVYPLKYFKGKFDVYQRTYVITSKDSRLSTGQIYFDIEKELEGFKGVSSGTTTKFLTMGILSKIDIILACETNSFVFNKLIQCFFPLKQLISSELEQLQKLVDLLMKKMSIGAT